MKKVLCIILAAVMALAAVSANGLSVFAADKSEKYIVGDVNSDGKINSADALLILQFAAGLKDFSAEQKTAADISNDGSVNSEDAYAVLKLRADTVLDNAGIDLKAYSELGYSYLYNVIANYKEFINEVGTDGTKIPMIISSDQHGTIKADCTVFKFIDELVDWNRISKVISLGDTVELLFNPVQLKAFSKAMQYVPNEKRLELEGNHDSHISLIKRNMDKYFIAPSAVKSEDGKAFCVKDDSFNVRYLAVNPMSYPWTYKSGRINTEQADFIVAELEKNDSSDIILLSHTYLFRDEIIKRDGTAFTGSDYFIGSDKKGTDVKQSFLDMLDARQERKAGVFTDSDGIKHPYDFTECKGELLMSLHGHHHTEGYETYEGFTEFLFQSFAHNGSENDDEPNCFYFAYIDKENKKFKCWKNIEGYSAWEIDIA